MASRSFQDCISNLFHGCWVLCVWIMAVHAQEGQTPTEATPTVPYRRIFVPQGDLNSIGLEGYSPIEASELDQLLKKNAAANANLALPYASPNEPGKGQLLSSHYVARLVGADLVSDRSRLMFSRPVRLGERLTLRPWSLAINFKSGQATPPANSPIWTFDEQGLPSVLIANTSVSELTPIEMLRSGEIASWFGWSASSKASSLPNQLQFTMDIPNCSDSCLVLILPPRAIVQDSSTVVRRLDNWSEVGVRLGNWPSPVGETSVSQTPSMTADSLWLVELGGSRRMAFSIMLGDVDRSRGSIPNDEAFRYAQLIKSQRLEHFVSDREIRTLCDAEILLRDHQEPTPVRMSLAPGSRLRKLTVNDRDVDWEVFNGWIQWIPSAGQGKYSTSVSTQIGSHFLNVAAEFVTPVLPNSSPRIATPRIAFERGYVMSGSTIVQATSPWKLASTECAACKIVDPATTNRSNQVNSIEYAWHASPPPLSIGIERELQTRKCDLMTRISVDDHGIKAVVRAKLNFLDQDANFVSFSLAPGWEVLSLESLDRNDPAKLVPSTGLNGSKQDVRLRWDRIQRNRIAEVEFVFLYPVSDTLQEQKDRHLKPWLLMQVPGWEQNNTLAIEDSKSYQLMLDDDWLERIVGEDAIPDWQRKLLSRSNKPFLLRLPPLTDEVDANAPKLTDLQWGEKPILHVASIRTEITRSAPDTLIALHEFQIQIGSNRERMVEIDYPADRVRWYKLDGSSWVSLQPAGGPSSLGDARQRFWRFNVPDQDMNLSLRAVASINFPNDEEVMLTVPQLANSRITSHLARCSSGNVSIHSAVDGDSWTLDADGFQVLAISSSNSASTLTVKPIDPPTRRPWIGWTSELDLALDTNGSQRASLVLRSKEGSLAYPIAIELEDHWNPINVRILANGQLTSIPYQLDGQRLVIGHSSNLPQSDFNGARLAETEGVTEVRMDFAGPKLERTRNIFSIQNRMSFRWPAFTTNVFLLNSHQRLWLPSELSVQGSTDHADQGQGLSYWPLWEQTRSLFREIFGNRLWKNTLSTTDPKSLAIEADHRHSFNDLVAGWGADNWQISLEQFDELPQPAKDSYATPRSKIFPIHRVGSGLSISIVMFAIFAMFTPRLISINFRLAAALAVLLIVCCHLHWLNIPLIAYPSLLGMCVGLCILAIHRLVTQKAEIDSGSPSRNSTRWAPWNYGDDRSDLGAANALSGGTAENVPSVARKVSTNLATFLLSLAASVFLSESSGVAGKAWGQTPSNQSDDEVYQIIIPMDESGNFAGNNVYVPDELRSLLTGRPLPIRDRERGTHPSAARYLLRIGGRGRADQITMTYDFVVGEDLSPVRFPFAIDQLQAIRFSVDGNELIPGNRLRRVGTVWEWSPEKPGKRTVQILGQPVLRSNAAEASKDLLSPASQSLEIAVIPIGNASIDIEVDPQMAVDVVALGQVLNPGSGRYSAMLGAVDRLQCRFTIQTSSSSTGFSPALTNGGEGIDAPVMHTELLLHHDILQAKTIIDFPKGVPLSREIEIEADTQWYPVGTDWGDAHWVELRPGSTLSRRRYVLEWTHGNPVPATGGPALSDRRIAIVWIPQPDSQSLNVLFAECRDRRTRLGTLRYSRTAGASWSIEGINTWIPAINAEERLDWPELKTSPIATALRIPFNGGFGVLKQKQTSERLQARISSKWSLDPLGETLSARLELLGGVSGSDSLHVDLPSSFSVTDVFNRNGPIRFLSEVSGNKLRIQLLSDRKSFEFGDIFIQAKRQGRDMSQQTPPGKIAIGAANAWGEIPWLELPANIGIDQSLDIVASDQLGIRFDQSGPDILVGKGVNQTLALLTKTASEPRSNAPATKYQVVHRVKALNGHVVLSTKPSGSFDTAEIELLGSFVRSPETKPYFALQVPFSLKDRWQCDSRVNVIPSPDSSQSWLQIYLPDNESVPNSRQSIQIHFFPSTDNSEELVAIASQIRPLDDHSISTFLVSNEAKIGAILDWVEVDEATKVRLAQEFALSSPLAIFEKQSTLVQNQRSVAEPKKSKPNIPVQQCTHQIMAFQQELDRQQASLVLETRYWIASDSIDPIANIDLELEIEEDIDILSVRVNGQSMAYSRKGSRCTCSGILAGLCGEVVIITQHHPHRNEDGYEAIIAPEAVDHWVESTLFLSTDSRIAVRAKQGILPAESPRATIGPLTQKWLSIFSESLDFNSQSKSRSRDSNWDHWQEHWLQRAAEYLQTWSQTSDSQDQLTYGESVRKLHTLRSSIIEILDSQPTDHEPVYSADLATLAGNSNFQPELTEVMDKDRQWDRWFSLLGCLAILVSVVLVPRTLDQVLTRRPWWYMLAIGFFVWLFSGSLLPALVLGTFGLIVLMDTYLIASERLRRTGLRGPR